MRSPVLLSPVQPCPTRTKHAASYIPPRAREEGRCGGTEEVWKDGGEKGRRQVYNWQGQWKAHKKKLCFDFIFLAVRKCEVCGSKAFDFGLKGD